jgi:hypothetical protein
VLRDLFGEFAQGASTCAGWCGLRQTRLRLSPMMRVSRERAHIVVTVCLRSA